MSNGDYFVTKFKPIIAEVGMSGRFEPYAEPGDPLGVRICSFWVEQIWGVESLKHLQSCKVDATGKPYGKVINYE